MTRKTIAGADEAAAAESTARFANDVQYYLPQEPRQLPSRYLYDALGTALFEAICRLPWYPLTRAERRLLGAHAHEIVTAASPLSQIVELGSGSGEKLVTLLEAVDAPDRHLEVHLIDVSPAALSQATRAISAHGDIRVITYATTYEAGLAQIAVTRPANDRLLMLFLGSNIGNFDPPGAEALMRAIRAGMRSRDLLLLGTDLVRPERDLLLAYDDPLGVTAAFNRNLLVRINRELGGDFDVGGFAHRAVWSEPQSRVEMHLLTTRSQHVRIPSARLEFDIQAGEWIWTESSYKFHPASVRSFLERAGFRVTAQWVDELDAFALTLAEAL